MSGWSRKCVLLLVLTVMPLQGVAATLADLLCDPGGQMHEIYSNGGHGHGTPQGGDQNTDNAGANPVWHPFHGTVLGPAVVISPVAAPDSPLRAHTPEISYDPFVPELPQRPPLA
jgi:hypothetical protein